MPLLQRLIALAAPIFLVLSPITSYADQILSMQRTRSSHGFSLDIPLIMLTASILKIFYWPGARFDLSLLIQAIVMIVVQSLLLKVALDNRITPLRSDALEMRINGKRSSSSSSSNSVAGGGYANGNTDAPIWLGRRERPDRQARTFWRWREQTPYWQYVGILAAGLATLHVLIRPAPGHAEGYTTLLGGVGLGIEAVLPLPQLWQNYTSQSCRGFRLSVVINWLFGDAMKMAFFFLSAPGAIPWTFKACGVFQALCDIGLGVQYWMYGEGPSEDGIGHFA